MKLSKETKLQITEEANAWLEKQYAGKSLKERQEFGQFFTPPELVIQMIEKFSNLDGTILDPCAGCGGLLAACIIAGADPKKIYGIEYDKKILKLCQKRLGAMGVPIDNIHWGDALDYKCYDFGPNYKWKKKEVQETEVQFSWFD